MPTVAQIVSLYPIAQYLAANDIPKKGLYGGGVNVLLPQKIYNIGQSVERIFDDDPSDDTLELTANFLWTLCGIYGQQALVVAQTPGSVTPITPPSGLPYPYDWIISGSSSSTEPLASGESSVVLNALRGYNIEFTRNNLTQNTTDPQNGGSWYSWDRSAALFTCSPAAGLGEQFRILPAG